MAAFMCRYSRCCNASAGIYAFAESYGHCLRIEMVGEHASRRNYLDIINAMVMEHLLCYLRT
jgi:hypothetical protein